MDTPTITTATVTLLFTDLVDSTPLLERLGDEAAGALRRAHFALLRREIAAAGGEEVKSLGDGLMVAFRSARAALVCAVAMQQAVAAANRSGPPVQIRVGLHRGEPHREEDDFFGMAVVVARRLCDRAQGGEILASEAAALLAGMEAGFRLRPVGPLALKGLSRAVRAVAVACSSPEAAPAPALQPVSSLRHMAGRDGQRHVGAGLIPSAGTRDHNRRCSVTTYVLDPTTVTVPAGRSGSGREEPRWQPATPPRHLEATGVGDGWRCLVVGDRGSVATWLQARVGETGSVFVTDLQTWGDGPDDPNLEVGLHDAITHPAFRGWFDLVYARLDAIHPLDRTRALENLLGSLRPGGWIVVEDAVALPFRLPAGHVVGTPGSGSIVTEAIRAVAEDHFVDLEWGRRLPDLLRDKGCSHIASEGLCAVWPGGSARVSLIDTGGSQWDEDHAHGRELPVELEPFRWLLLDPFRGRLLDSALAVNSTVLFSTCGRR